MCFTVPTQILGRYLLLLISILWVHVLDPALSEGVPSGQGDMYSMIKCGGIKAVMGEALKAASA